MPAGFANAIDRSAAPNRGLAWLAGLLEAEGTFLKPIPSEPELPAVACQMTDLDVVRWVGQAFGTTTNAIAGSGSYRTVHITRLKGARAVALMRDLMPMMGARRSRAIRRALRGYLPPERKLDFLAAEEIRELHALGATITWLARTFAVSRPTIRQVVEGTIYEDPPRPDAPWRTLHLWDDDDLLTDLDVNPFELAWLAGWLEGEGSFTAPPPSDPKRVRISGVTIDADVAQEVGRLLQVSPLRSHSAQEQRRGRSATWRILRRGALAVSLMQALHPLMGDRRQLQIESALAALADGGAGNRNRVRKAVPM